MEDIPESSFKGENGGETPFYVFFEELNRTVFAFYANSLKDMGRGGVVYR
jgi:hypothetical protein